jgi:hypothetical protein
MIRGPLQTVPSKIKNPKMPAATRAIDGTSEANDTQLVLVSARKSRRGEHWDKDDYDVRLGDGCGPVVGRIMRHPQAPEAQPWFWTITSREQPPSVYNRGYAASREHATRLF